MLIIIAGAEPAPAPAPAPAPVKPIELRLSHHDATTIYSPGNRACVNWAEEVEKATEGKVKVTVYGASTFTPCTQ